MVKLHITSGKVTLLGYENFEKEEFPKLKERYWGQHFWASGYGVWSTGYITDKMVNEYLEHHRRDSSDNSNFILE